MTWPVVFLTVVFAVPALAIAWIAADTMSTIADIRRMQDERSEMMEKHRRHMGWKKP